MTSEISKTADPNDFDHVSKIADFIKNQIPLNSRQPELLVICGSGLNSLAEEVKNAKSLSYSDIPGFPVGNVKGHKGCLVFGELAGKFVMCMQGRVHPYEGHSLALCALPIRVAKLLGVKGVLMTSAVGGINKTLKQGQLIVIKDHLFVPGMTMNSPLVGKNDERFGLRFPSSTNLYDIKLRQKAHQVAKAQNQPLREGVYAMSGGPQFETPAEIRWLALSGADVVGMSVCHETVVARHCELPVLTICLVTNVCEWDSDAPQQINMHDEVLETGLNATKAMCSLIKGVLEEL